jgi:hypothetical protein
MSHRAYVIEEEIRLLTKVPQLVGAAKFQSKICLTKTTIPAGRQWLMTNPSYLG